MSSPFHLIWPRDGRSRPISIFTVVLLPEPLGPSRPTTWPGLAVMLSMRTAATPR